MSGKRLKTGAHVAFRLADVLSPDYDQILFQMGPDLSVPGEIVLLSDRGKERDHFAILNVTGINVPLIVPVRKLILNESSETAEVIKRS